MVILTSAREGLRLFHVLDRYKADAAPIVIDNDQALYPMLMQELAGGVFVRAFAHRVQILPRHDVRDCVTVIGEADVAIGHDADEATGLAFGPALNHWKTRYATGCFNRLHFAY